VNTASDSASQGRRVPGRIKIGKGLADVSAETLRFYRQIGVEEVSMPARYVDTPRPSRPHVPPAQTGPAGPQAGPWNAGELRRIRDRIESFGLAATTMGLGLSGNILLGRPGCEADVEKVKQSIRVAGEVGLRVLTYNFGPLRASAGYYSLDGQGRGGAHLRAFDFDRVRDLPPLESVGRHTRDELWGRLEAFLRAVVPVAEASGVRLAMHPNDPPVAEFRGIAQPVRSLADLKRVVEVVDSPANSLYLDTGVLTEMGEDAPEAIRYFGRRDRIGSVHFRNVLVEVPYERYVETFLDEGQCDMFACMQAFQEVGYTGALDPDHTPGVDGDTPTAHAGWAFAIGQIIALRSAAAAVTPT
jgi:mannonate dehydratase